jgi:hypothetical protein
MPPVARAQRVAEIKRAHVEGQAADVGAQNPYRGQIVLAAVWRAGYRRMLDDMLANSPARQAFLHASMRRRYRRVPPRSLRAHEHRCLRASGWTNGSENG